MFNIKEQIESYLSTHCVICKEEKKPWQISWHHIDRKTKKYEISNIWNNHIVILISELIKTIPCCHNCHSTLTHYQNYLNSTNDTNDKLKKEGIDILEDAKNKHKQFWDEHFVSFITWDIMELYEKETDPIKNFKTKFKTKFKTNFIHYLVHDIEFRDFVLQYKNDSWLSDWINDYYKCLDNYNFTKNLFESQNQKMSFELTKGYGRYVLKEIGSDVILKYCYADIYS